MFVSMRFVPRGSGTPAWPRIGTLAAFLIGAATAGLAPPAVPDARASDPVVLNEILADPARDWDEDGAVHSRDDEWVEIANAGAATVNLDGYRIAGADTVWRYGFTGTLAPGEVRVVYGGQSYAWEQLRGFPQYGLRLANTGGTVNLWYLSVTDTVLVDAYTYVDHEAEDDRSSGRVPDGGFEWRLFDALNPYSGKILPSGSGCTPSPGVLFQCPVPIKTGTWGGLKTRYRTQRS